MRRPRRQRAQPRCDRARRLSRRLPDDAAPPGARRGRPLLRDFRASAGLDDGAPDRAQPRRGARRPRDADDGGDRRHGAAAELRRRREDRAVADLLSRRRRADRRPRQQAHGFPAVDPEARDAGGPSVVVSTLCQVHNAFGRCYLAAVIPFHKFGVRTLLTRAIKAGRL
ncbi:MAG: DUF2867 domain-containing protein [Proteobacteria bacterium]|nr:DUF2867 domain-containing protein [Pseudomonadota bacterium]